MASRKPLTRKPSTAPEIAAAKQAHKEIRAAGFTPTEDNTFIMDDRVWARSQESIPGTGGHPIESRVLPVKRKPLPGFETPDPLGYSLRLQQTDKTWKNDITDMTLVEAKRRARNLLKQGYFPAVFYGRKKVWEPK